MAGKFRRKILNRGCGSHRRSALKCVLNPFESLTDHQTMHMWERLGGLKQQLLEASRTN